MGKMKGNRLNTAANVGTFVTNREQLAQQRAIAANSQAAMEFQKQQLEIQRQQAYEADYDRLMHRTDREVALGRMTRRQADFVLFEAQICHDVEVGRKNPDQAFYELLVHRADLDVAEGRATQAEASYRVHLEWYNHKNPAPKPGSRVTHSFGAMMNASMGPAVPGWYNKEPGIARRWDGARWTLETMPATTAKEIARREWLSVSAQGHVQKSRTTAGILGILLGFVGAHRFYLGDKGWGFLQAGVFLLTFAFTFGLVGLWGVAEGIMILCRADIFSRDAAGVPLK
ncbi:NINE protein [Pseudarthrobacter sp. C4D7]|uniref:NINE protein n=1 Tax=Pseudarthrobacter sp. C4D7 TaxID=2735268 RepID=UPI0015854C47|nr:NINE protein [Pseudarthrobacter sp. C4D7]NUT72333.1 NINE protein [Pseudarthrobacter sp. C4D7]